MSKYIAVIDSGIGGLSVLSLLRKEFPSENFLYFGDNENSPYGNKSERSLLSITMKNLDYILSFGVKIIVLACNTLSATLMYDIKTYSGKQTFGVFPPVHKYVMKNEKTLLLCTPLTAERYIGTPGLYVLSLPDLASEIEKNAFNLNNVNLDNVLSEGDLYVPGGESLPDNRIDNVGLTTFDHGKNAAKFRSRDYKFAFDTVICGCTHYSLIKKQIFDHLKPTKIICGEDFTIGMMKKSCGIVKSSVKCCKNDLLFVGKNAVGNEKVYCSVVNTSENSI